VQFPKNFWSSLSRRSFPSWCVGCLPLSLFGDGTRYSMTHGLGVHVMFGCHGTDIGLGFGWVVDPQQQ
jgi:hypothetical protein